MRQVDVLDYKVVHTYVVSEDKEFTTLEEAKNHVKKAGFSALILKKVAARWVTIMEWSPINGFVRH
jgi:hypothetical protein